MNEPYRCNSTTRRRLLTVAGGTASALLFPALAWSSKAVGNVGELVGRATAERESAEIPLMQGTDILLQDRVVTGDRSIVELLLGQKTQIRLGENAQLLIDEYVMGMSGSFELMQGAMFFDRPEDAPKAPVTVKTLFGQLGVRGTRFFAGPNRDVFAVFVERGVVEVSAGGFAVQLQAGDGVDIPSPCSPPSEVKQWGEGRIREVYAAVGLTR